MIGAYKMLMSLGMSTEQLDQAATRLGSMRMHTVTDNPAQAAMPQRKLPKLLGLTIVRIVPFHCLMACFLPTNQRTTRPLSKCRVCWKTADGGKGRVRLKHEYYSTPDGGKWELAAFS